MVASDEYGENNEPHLLKKSSHIAIIRYP
jgi:hypothetical protein